VSHPLLDLGPFGNFLDDAGELAESGDLTAGEIADVGDSHEGEEVMLAHAIEADVADEDDFVVAFLENSGEVVRGRGMESGEEFGVHASNTSRRFEQTFAIGIFPDCGENLTDGPFDPGEIDGAGGFGVGVRGIGAVRHRKGFQRGEVIL